MKFAFQQIIVESLLLHFSYSVSSHLGKWLNVQIRKHTSTHLRTCLSAHARTVNRCFKKAGHVATTCPLPLV